MVLEAWPRKYLVLALGALLCINAIQLCHYLIDGQSKGSTLRLLLRTAITAGPHETSVGEAETPAGLNALRPSIGEGLEPGRGHLAVQKSALDPGLTSAVFILFSWNYDLFWTSLQTYVAAGWGPRLIIIDNSKSRRVLNDAKVQSMVTEIIPTRVQLTFSQLQNFIADVAIERDYKYYFWGHADVALMASNATASFSEEVLGCVERVMVAEPKWGILYFTYDWFSAIRTDLVREVQYDTFITVYMSDCDFYPRVRAAGWSTLQYADHCPGISPRAYDMKRAVELPGEYEAMREVLEREEREEDIERNAWKRSEWRDGEDLGWDNWGSASLKYFRQKWGSTGEGGDDCAEVEVPALDDSMMLKQQPFQGRAKRAPARRRGARLLQELP